MSSAASLQNQSTSRVAKPVRFFARPDAIWTLLYLLLMACTGAFFMADTVDYVQAAVLRDQGINYVFWDFRHLFWRPLGWLLLHISKWFIHYDNLADARSMNSGLTQTPKSGPNFLPLAFSRVGITRVSAVPGKTVLRKTTR